MQGPAEYLSPNEQPKVKIGDTPTLDFPVFDGIPVSGWPNGKPVELSSGTVTGHLLVQNPDNVADYELACTKVKTSNLAGITSDTFRATIPTGVTGSWVAGTPGFVVEWRDSNGTRVITIVDGKLAITAKSTDAA